MRNSISPIVRIWVKFYKKKYKNFRKILSKNVGNMGVGKKNITWKENF